MYRIRHRHQIRERLYGITRNEYETLLAAQGGRCAICVGEWTGHHIAPHIDHDHATGKVRGLLCVNCNNGLGRFGDDPRRLRAAAQYLEVHASV